MDHGSHTFYLAFDWLNAWPTSLTAKMVNQEPDLWDTEDDFSATLMFPGNRTAHVHMTWTAGARSVIYTIHGDRGAIIARDDDIEVLTQGHTTTPGEMKWEVDRQVASSSWMDASHTEWFNAMFDRFLTAVESRDYAGEDVRDACRCIAVIREAYASASASCIERHLLAPSGFEQRTSVSDRRVAMRGSRPCATRLSRLSLRHRPATHPREDDAGGRTCGPGWVSRCQGSCSGGSSATRTWRPSAVSWRTPTRGCSS